MKGCGVMKTGDRIKKRRLELGYSVDQLAEKINKNRATIYRYENNDIGNLPASVLEPLAIALQTTPAHLLGWSIEQSENDLKDIFAENLKSLLKSKRITINKLSIDLEIPTATISRWLNAVTYPRPDKIQLLADYFNVYRSDLTEINKSIESLDIQVKSEEKDIANTMSGLLEQIDSSEALMFDGEILDEQTKELFKASLLHTMQVAKTLSNKKNS